MNTIKLEIIEFLNHCKYEKNLNSKTIKAYSIDLKQFLSFMIDHKKSLFISDISKNEIRGFLESISNMEPKSIKRKIATIKSMFNFLEFEDKIFINPFRKMKIKIQEEKKLPRVMDIEDIKAILKSAYALNNLCNDASTYTYSETLRNAVVIELLFATGARVSEIANLKLENINVLVGAITIKGKGNKERIIEVCNKETIRLLKKYQNHFMDKIHNSGGYFLVNRLGNKLSDQSIRCMVKTISNNVGITKHITPHVFRHSLATLLLENDVDIKYIQTILGHSSIMTTQIYTHVNRKKQRQILTLKHPRKNLCMASI